MKGLAMTSSFLALQIRSSIASIVLQVLRILIKPFQIIIVFGNTTINADQYIAD